MTRFGDLEAAIMDVVWAAGTPAGERPVRVREVSERLNRERPLAFNTVQTVMENLFRKGSLDRHKDSRAYRYEPIRSRTTTRPNWWPRRWKSHWIRPRPWCGWSRHGPG